MFLVLSFTVWSSNCVLFTRSRLAGSAPKTSKLLTLNVFLNYYSDYDDNGDTGLRIFNEWIKLVWWYLRTQLWDYLEVSLWDYNWDLHQENLSVRLSSLLMRLHFLRLSWRDHFEKLFPVNFSTVTSSLFDHFLNVCGRVFHPHLLHHLHTD